MENWKKIKGFEAYEVSDLGRVRRTLPGQHTHIGKILKPNAGHSGYLKVDLFRNGKHNTRKLHKLVANAFLPNPKSLPQVNHTGKKTDNKVSKLERITTKAHGRDRARREQSSGDGVRRYKATPKNRRLTDVWIASYCPIPRKRKHIGYFNTFAEAKAARDAKIKTLK